MARRRANNVPSVNLVPTTEAGITPGFSISPVAALQGDDYISIYTYKETQLRALRNAYTSTLHSESQESIDKRAKLATLIEIVQTTYRSIPESEERLDYVRRNASNDFNKAIWLCSMESGVRKALHELLGSQTVSLPSRIRMLSVFLVEELTEINNALDVIMGIVHRTSNLTNPNTYLRRLSYTWTSPVTTPGSPISMTANTDNESIRITNEERNANANEVIRSAITTVIDMIRSDELLVDALMNSNESIDSGPNRWQILSGTNGIEGVILNGRRLNAQSVSIRSEPGSITRLSLEVLIVPSSDILSFTSVQPPGYSDGGLRNVRTPSTVPPAMETVPQPQPNVRRLDI